MRKIALTVVLALGVVSLASAEERNATSMRKFNKSDGYETKAEACAAAKRNATSDASADNQKVARFSNCDCSSQPKMEDPYKWICNVDYTTEKKK